MDLLAPVEVARYLLTQTEPVTAAEWARVFGLGWLADPNAAGAECRLAELRQANSLTIRATLRTAEGRPVPDFARYQLRIRIYGNDYRADFKAFDGATYAEWTMGRQGWWYDPAIEGGAGLLDVVPKDGRPISTDLIRGVGWCSVAGCDRCHADPVFVIGPPPEPDDQAVILDSLALKAQAGRLAINTPPGPEPDIAAAIYAIESAQRHLEQAAIDLEIALMKLAPPTGQARYKDTQR